MVNYKAQSISNFYFNRAQHLILYGWLIADYLWLLYFVQVIVLIVVSSNSSDSWFRNNELFEDYFILLKWLQEVENLILLCTFLIEFFWHHFDDSVNFNYIFKSMNSYHDDDEVNIFYDYVDYHTYANYNISCIW